MRIGVLALQGAFAKHIEMLRSLLVDTIEVRKPADLLTCDALVIPGGESTVMKQQMTFIHLEAPLKEFAQKKPLFGTCAGLILMSKEIIADNLLPLNILDISVERNAFGRQVESFHIEIPVTLNSARAKPFEAVFIRAPRIRRVGEEVKVLAQYEGEAVLIQQGHHLAATFHPELTADAAIHAYFVRMVKDLK